jgi:hypothetical protein
VAEELSIVGFDRGLLRQLRFVAVAVAPGFDPGGGPAFGARRLARQGESNGLISPISMTRPV